MIMRIGLCCKLCNIIFKDDEEALKHFIEEHKDLVRVKLDEFLENKSYLDIDDVGEEK